MVLVRRDGTTTPARVRSVFVEDVRDSDAAAVVVVREASSAPGLPSGENDYRAVVAAVHEGVVVHALDGRVVSCNPSAERILRLPAADIVGRDWPHWNPVHEDGTPFSRDENPTAITASTGRPQTDVVMGLAMPDGERRWIAVNLEAVPADDGGPTAVVSSFTDISERRTREGMVSRLGRILSQSRDEAYVFDARTLRLLQVNRSAVTNSGYTMDELHTMTPLELLPELDEDAFEAIVEPLRTGDVQRVQFETVLRRRDETTYRSRCGCSSSAPRPRP